MTIITLQVTYKQKAEGAEATDIMLDVNLDDRKSLRQIIEDVDFICERRVASIIAPKTEYLGLVLIAKNFPQVESS